MAQEEKEKKVMESENQELNELSQKSVDNSETTESKEELPEDEEQNIQANTEPENSKTSDVEENKSEDETPQTVSEKKESVEEEKIETENPPVSKESEPEAEKEVSKEEPNEVTAKADATEQESSEDEDHDEDEDSDDDDHHLDYSNYSKTQLVQAIESQFKNNDLKEVGKILKEIKPAYDEIFDSEKEEAYQKYLEEGGEKDGFEYKQDELDLRFQEAYEKLREKRHSFINSMAKQKDENLAKKQMILEKLREIVEEDETFTV